MKIFGKSGVYKIINTVNGFLYIGSAVNLGNRWSSHKKDFRKQIHTNAYLQNAWNKYGEKAFEFEVIEFVIDKNNLINREQYWMDYYKSYERDKGYNLCPKAANRLGAISGPSPFKGIKRGPDSYEVRQRKSEAQKRRWADPIERNKIINSRKGKHGPSWSKGLTKKDHPSLVQIGIKGSLARTGKKRASFTNIHKENISKAKKGKKIGPFSPDHRRHLSDSLVGNTRNLGKKQSIETQEKKRQTFYRNHPEYTPNKIVGD